MRRPADGDHEWPGHDSGHGQPAGRGPATGDQWPGRAGLRVATGLLVATVLAAVAGAALTVVAWGDLVTRDGISNLGACVAAIAYATLGALIIRRAGNLVGWLMLGEGAGLMFLALGSAYAVTGIITHPGRSRRLGW